VKFYDLRIGNTLILPQHCFIGSVLHILSEICCKGDERGDAAQLSLSSIWRSIVDAFVWFELVHDYMDIFFTNTLHTLGGIIRIIIQAGYMSSTLHGLRVENMLIRLCCVSIRFINNFLCICRTNWDLWEELWIYLVSLLHLRVENGLVCFYCISARLYQLLFCFLFSVLSSELQDTYIIIHILWGLKIRSVVLLRSCWQFIDIFSFISFPTFIITAQSVILTAQFYRISWAVYYVNSLHRD